MSLKCCFCCILKILVCFIFTVIQFKLFYNFPCCILSLIHGLFTNLFRNICDFDVYFIVIDILFDSVVVRKYSPYRLQFQSVRLFYGLAHSPSALFLGIFFLSILIPGSGSMATPKQESLCSALRETATQYRCCQSHQRFLFPSGGLEAENLKTLVTFKAWWDQASSGHIRVLSSVQCYSS